MQTVDILTLEGHSPYNISICDVTYTNCFLVASDIVTAPITVNVPSVLTVANQLIVVVMDSLGCSKIEAINCLTPVPTTSPTTSPTPTPTNISCSCIIFDNPTISDSIIGYIDCNGVPINTKIAALSTLYICGKSPYADPGIIVTLNNPCVENSCPKPSQTPTPTPTPTNIDLS
jgi:hypothetical protein